jgi:hypothetical protein
MIYYLLAYDKIEMLFGIAAARTCHEKWYTKEWHNLKKAKKYECIPEQSQLKLRLPNSRWKLKQSPLQQAVGNSLKAPFPTKDIVHAFGSEFNYRY